MLPGQRQDATPVQDQARLEQHGIARGPCWERFLGLATSFNIFYVWRVAWLLVSWPDQSGCFFQPLPTSSCFSGALVVAFWHVVQEQPLKKHKLHEMDAGLIRCVPSDYVNSRFPQRLIYWV